MTPGSITLKANSNQLVRVKGKYLTVTACTSALQVELDNQGRATATAGAQFSKADGFSKVTFVETSGSDNAVSYIISDSPSPARAIVVGSNQATFAGANSGEQDYGTGGVTLFNYPGVDSEGRHRKSFIVSNSGNTGSGASNSVLAVEIVGGLADGKLAAIIPPGTNPVTIDTDENLRVLALNPNLSGQPAHLLGTVLELFFVKPLQQDA